MPQAIVEIRLWGGRYAAVAGVHKHETAGAVGVLGHARRKARLPEKRRLLIARHACYGDCLTAKEVAAGVAEYAA